MKKTVIIFLFLGSLLYGDVLFKKSSVLVGVLLGSGSIEYSSTSSSTTQNYFIIGVSGDYFVYDDVSIGFGVQQWMGDSPTLTQYTLPLTYYHDLNRDIYPYMGVLYRFNDYHGVYKDLFGREYSAEDTSLVGARVGVAYRVHFGYFGLGLISEYDLKNSQSSTYPEFVIGFIF